MFHTIGIIGTGTMGGALAGAIVKGGFDGTLLLANRTPEKAEALCHALGYGAVSSNIQIAVQADLIILSVKPQLMNSVLAEISDALRARRDSFVLCSPAAGLSCETLCRMVGGEYPILRLMPNTPVTVGCGMTQLCSRNASVETVDAVLHLLRTSGCIDVIDERLMDAACAVSGCGPAFAYLFAEALADGGVACGLPRNNANLYAARLLAGAAEMLLETGKTPGELKDAVCSPGGATIEGVFALEQGGFRGTVMQAVMDAYEKTVKLGEKK